MSQLQSVLCDLCRSIDLATILQYPHPGHQDKPRIKHHPNLHSLRAASQSGCKLCYVFYAGVLDWLDSGFGFPRAEAFQREDESSLAGFTISGMPQGYLHPDLVPFASGYRALYYGRAGPANAYPRQGTGPVHCEGQFDLMPLTPNNTLLPMLITRQVAQRPKPSLGVEWIHQCGLKHTACPKIEDTDLPTRLINVGSDQPVREPRLEHTAGRKGQYVALSHCWGDSSPPKTTTKSTARHVLGIPFSTLPRTFQDAVTTTRQLGFKYLWIDCFCILQDDDADWQHECSRMQLTFANATVTIAGPGAGSADAGFLHERQPATGASCEVDIWDKRTGRGLSKVKVTLVRIMQQSTWSSENKQMDSALATRAWILQERLLSARVLYFGSTQMYFECATADYHENLIYPLQSEAGGVVGDDASVSKDLLLFDDASKSLRNWYSIVVAYSTCNLSKGNDKLPALSGLAARYQKYTNDSYLAGLWRSELAMGLTWYRDPDYTVEKSREGATVHHPSWSWASCDYKIMYAGFATLGRDDMRSQLTVNYAATDIVGLDPLGQVRNGQLSVTGTVRRAILQRDPESGEERHWIYPLYSDNDYRTIGPCLKDISEPATPTTDMLAEREVTCLLLGTQSKNRPLRVTGNSFIALILVPVQSSERNSYRRIGLMDTFLIDLRDDIFMKNKESLAWMQSGSRKTVKII